MDRKTTVEIVAVEGWRLLATLFGITMLLFIIDLPRVAFLFFVVFIFFVFYFRNLERTPEESDELAVISPIDGLIRSINIDGSYIDITISNRLIDAHILRMPIQGALDQGVCQMGICGKFASSLERLSQKQSLFIKSSSTKLEVEMVLKEQVNRSKIYKNQQNAFLGERIGFFYGGEVVLRLPKTSELKIAEGAKVYGAKSIIGFVRNKK